MLAIPDLESAVKETCSMLHDTLEKARLLHKEHGALFVDDHIGVLCGGIEAYAHLFKKTELNDRTSFDKAVGNAGSGHLTEESQKLMDTEEDWVEFLKEVEQDFDVLDPQTFLQENDVAQIDVNLQVVGDSLSNLYLGDVVEKLPNNSLPSIQLGDVFSLLASEEKGKQSVLLVLNRHFA